jgi:cytochrome P450
MVIPGCPRFLASKWAYRYRSLFDYLPSIFCTLLIHIYINRFPDWLSPDGISTLVESMYKIRRLSRQLLHDKLQEAAHVSDIDAKRDIMNILVRAQKADKEGGEGYKMNDRAMMDQVVRFFQHTLILGDTKSLFVKLTFLGAGHETTASGLTWVGYSPFFFLCFS